MNQSEHNGGSTAADGSADGAASPVPIRKGYWLLPIQRGVCLGAGVFVFYSQLVSAGLVWLYRYHVRWDRGRYYKEDGYLDEAFLVLTILSPGGSIGVMERYDPYIRLGMGLVLAALGSAGLFLAAFAKQGSRCSTTLVCFLGLAAAGCVDFLRLFRGAGELEIGNFLNIDNPYEFFPIQGVFEFVGAFVVPVVLYPVLILLLVGGALLGAVRGLRR